MTGQRRSHIKAVEAGERAPRVPANAPAQISFGDVRSRMECRVVNMSASGACIRLTEPERFDEFLRSRRDRRLALILDKGTITVECVVAWSREGHAGVSFQSGFIRTEAARTFTPATPSPVTAAAMRGRTFGRR